MLNLRHILRIVIISFTVVNTVLGTNRNCGQGCETSQYCRNSRDLRNCRECRNCGNCADCTNCRNCYGCTNCEDCRNCTNCTDWFVLKDSNIWYPKGGKSRSRRFCCSKCFLRDSESTRSQFFVLFQNVILFRNRSNIHRDTVDIKDSESTKSQLFKTSPNFRNNIIMLI